MAVNYNKDLDPRLFGRDTSGKARSKSAPAEDSATSKPKPTPKQQTEKAKTKPSPEYRITEVTIVVPSGGLKKDQPFDIKGKAQPLVAPACSTVLFIIGGIIGTLAGEGVATLADDQILEFSEWIGSYAE